MSKLLPLLPSASHHELAEHCRFAWNGGVSWPPRGEPGPAQRYGIAFHEVAQAAVQPVSEEGWESIVPRIAERLMLTRAEERRLLGAATRLDAVLDADGLCSGDSTLVGSELAYCYSTTTSAVRLASDRKDKAPHEIYGATDLAFWRGDGKLVVRDWKTGERARGKRPIETRQLRFLALCAARTLYVEEVRVELAFVDEDADEIVGDDLDALELGAIEGELAELVEQLGQPPEPRPGPWCERYYCPLRAVCPATVAAMATIYEELDRYPLVGELLSAEHAAALRHRLPVLRAMLEERTEAVEAWALRNGPLPVQGQPGVVWGPRQCEGRERIEATPEALRIVRALLGEHGAEAAVEASLSKASLERGARTAAGLAVGGGRIPRGAVKATLEPLLEALRAAKAVKKGANHTRFEEFKRTNGEEAGDE